MLPAMIALVAAYVPSRIHTWLKHPMLVAIKIWALAHLLANGDLAALVLFGSFLAFAVYDRISVKRRAALGPLGAKTGPWYNDLIVLGAGHRALSRYSSCGCTSSSSGCHRWRERAIGHERKHGENGRLIGIAVRGGTARPCRRARARSSRSAAASKAIIEGQKYPRRGVTVLAREAWEPALADAGRCRRSRLDRAARKPARRRRRSCRARSAASCASAPWCSRSRPDDAVLAHGGGRRAPARALPGMARRHHRRVLEGGRVKLGDRVEVLVSPPERKIRLPG